MADLSVLASVAGRPCLVVGGGDRAAATVERLIHARAQVTVASPQLSGELHRRAAEGLLRHHSGCFTPDLIEGQALVVAATDNPLSNRWVAEHALRRNVPVSTTGSPAPSVSAPTDRPVFRPNVQPCMSEVRV